MLLRSRGRLTAADLAAELEVSVRTVMRDVEALSASGVPVYTDRGRGGGISLLPGYRTDLTGLTLDEAKALLASGSGRVDSPAFANAMRKVVAALPDPHRAEATRAAQRILVVPDGFTKRLAPEPFLADLQHAVIEGHRIAVTYSARNAEPAVRILDPVGLVHAGEIWYLLALRDGVERTYRTSRIEALTVLDAPADRPAEIDLQAAFDRRRTSFLESLPKIVVTCRVRDDVWDRLVGANTVVVSRTAGGDGWSDADLWFGDSDHAIRALWIGGPDVVVISPDHIRDAIARRAAHTAANYPEERDIRGRPPRRGST